MTSIPVYDGDGFPTGQEIDVEDICHPWPGTEVDGFHSVHPRFSSGLPSHVVVRDEDVKSADG